jgi:hypothetical protein
MRNIFDQYTQPENKLTHALVSGFHREPQLLRSFLKWAGIKAIPEGNIQIHEQHVPGLPLMSNGDEEKGLPDAFISKGNQWAVIIESKVQSDYCLDQLRRHRKTAVRFGFDNPQLILITVNSVKRCIHGVISLQWNHIFKWLSKQTTWSTWARIIADYMQVFESKMLADEYSFEGTITMFSGFQFNKEQPYTYLQGKRIIKLLGEDFRKNRILLLQLMIDPDGKGRGAIKQGKDGSVWDFIPLQVAKNANSFVSYPHLTMAIRPDEVLAAITIPNAIHGGFRSKLKRVGFAGFQCMCADVEKNLRKVLKKSAGSVAMLYLHQRHYNSQSSPAETHARLDVDLRTAVKGSCFKYQPMWLESIYNILIQKRTNIQLGAELIFPYTCPLIKSEKAADLMVEAWVGMVPLLKFALE